MWGSPQKLPRMSLISITKSLNGNVDYKNKRRVYGGTRKKIKKIIEHDEKIKDLLTKIAACKDEKW
jgi:hypothetical protein